jgi:DNA-dependent protein kinase catalytic subunit
MSSESMNVVEIEIDSLNDHECMSHLISVIRYMHDKEMYLIPRNEEERRTSKLPTWMQSIKSKLMDPTTTERNIKLLLLRLILNSKEIFLPFTSHFLKDLLSLITTKNMWPKGKILNYFFIDVTVMLLSWSEATDVIPNVSLMERSSVTSLFEQLLKGLEHPRRDIFRYILDIIRVMVELWGSCIHFDYSIIHKLFSKTSFQNNSLSPSERYVIFKTCNIIFNKI